MPKVPNQRIFLLRNAEGRNKDITAKLELLSGNKSAHFSVTSQNGCDHEAILACSPPEVREDLEKLIAVHLCDADGTPMHALANAAYHLSESAFMAAHGSLNEVGGIEALYTIHNNVEVALDASRPDSRINRQINEIQEAAQNVVTSKAEYDTEQRLRESMFPNSNKFTRYVRALGRLSASLNIKDYAVAEQALNATGVGESLKLRRAALAQFEKAKLPELAEVIIRQGFPAGKVNIRPRLRTALFEEGVAAHIEIVCRPVWTARAAEAIVLLQKPDFKCEGRPDPEVDPITFQGFLHSQNVKLSVQASGVARSGEFRNTPAWACTLIHDDGRSVNLPFYSRDEPKPADLLECLQLDASTVLYSNRDEWLEEFGYAGNAKKLREGEKAYKAIEENTAALKNLFGDDGWKDFMTAVGDNPPQRAEDFDPPAPSL